MQYIIGVSPITVTTYYYDTSDDFIVTWASELLDMDNPPLVNSISYGSEESQFSNSAINQFETTARLLSLQGVTLLAGSGDDGVSGHSTRVSAENCGYHPIWPTTSPYVVSIGGTQGPESGSTEIACSSKTGGVITTGGGFSTLYSRPSWQDTLVSNYFAVVNASPPATGYNENGRAYPDVSAMAYNYNVIVGGNWTLQSGTVI